MADPLLLRAEFLQAIEAVEQSTRELGGLIKRRSTEIWLWKGPGRPAPDKSDRTAEALRRDDLDQAANCFRTLEYQDDQDGPETSRLVGLIAVPRDVIACAARTNVAKDRLVQAWNAFGDRKVIVEAPDGIAKHSVLLRRHVLEGCGRARHHQRMAQRHIVAIAHAVQSVSFSWARVAPIRRSTCDELRVILHQRAADGSEVARVDLKRLEKLTGDEPIALVGATHVQPRANINWVDSHGASQAKMVRAMSPILVLGEQLPRFRRLPDAPSAPESRLPRVKQIASEPFLESLKAYRYLDPHSVRARVQRENTPGFAR